MGWLFALVLVIGTIWLAISFPGFRRALIAFVIIIVGTIWFFVSHQNEKEAIALRLIKPSDIQLSDLVLKQSFGEFTLEGQINNLSNYTLAGIVLRIIAYDCPTNEFSDKCAVIGDENAYPFVTVPPHQLRQLNADVSFSNMPTPKNFKWRYEIEEIRANTNTDG